MEEIIIYQTADGKTKIAVRMQSVKHEDAIEKAHCEYDVYRMALPGEHTDVERAYLDTLKDMRKRLKGGEPMDKTEDN